MEEKNVRFAAWDAVARTRSGLCGATTARTYSLLSVVGSNDRGCRTGREELVWMPEDELRDAVLRMRATQQALPRPGTRRVHRQLGLRSAPRERFLRAPVPPVGTGLDAQSAPEPEVSRTLLPTVTLASAHGAEVPLVV